MTNLKLYGAQASGSIAVEAALTLLDIPYDLIEGATPVPSGVVRVMELQEAGYAYIKP